MPLLNKKSKIVKRLPVLYPAKMNDPIAQLPTGNILQREMNQCTNELYSKLLHLKRMGILSLSLRPTFTLVHDQSSPIHSRPTQSLSENSFQVLEFYGDSVLQHYISKMLCTTHAFMSPHLLTQFRICCVCNENLSSVYDTLHLKTLIPYQELVKELEMNPPLNGSSEKIDGFKKHYVTPKDKIKAKADIVEALIGELSKVIEQEPNSGLPQVVSHCKAALDELMSFIYCSGELKFFSKFYSSSKSTSTVTASNTSTATIPSKTKTSPSNQAAKLLPITNNVNNNIIQMKKIHQPKKPLMKKPHSPSSVVSKDGLQTPFEFLKQSPTTKQSKQNTTLITPSQLLNK